jgi:LCP family protein required for cell wall assembly
MAIKKFFMTFTILIFCFLVGAGVVLIQVINNAEAKALDETLEAIDKGLDPTGGTTEENDDVFVDYFGTEPFNALLLVRDKVGANTDAIMLINLDTINNKISIMSIPRDTIASRDLNLNGRDDDIMNMVYATHDLDIEKTIQYFSREYDVNIKYGAVMKLNAFREIIDQLGGVDFNVPALMDYDDPYQDLHIYFEPGMQFFNGEDAEKLLRFRQNNEGVDEDYWNGSDMKRIEMQQSFIQELITQKKKLFYATKINSIIGIIFDNLDTNIKPEEIINLLPDVLKADLGNIEFMTLPVHDAEDHIHLIPEKDAIKEIIESNFKGVK